MRQWRETMDAQAAPVVRWTEDNPQLYIAGSTRRDGSTEGNRLRESESGEKGRHRKVEKERRRDGGRTDLVLSRETTTEELVWGEGRSSSEAR